MTWKAYMHNGNREALCGNFDGAQFAFRKALKEVEKFGPIDSRLEEALDALVNLSWTHNKQATAVAYIDRLLAIKTQKFGMNSLQLVELLDRKAESLFDLGKTIEAEALCRKILHIQRTYLGDDDSEVATTSNKLANVCHANRNYVDAEKFYKQALAAHTKNLGCNDPTVCPSGPSSGRTAAGYVVF
ncbi:hypothetical protein BH10CYA1_BH10CYA1_62310 [soil metagenome]